MSCSPHCLKTILMNLQTSKIFSMSALGVLLILFTSCQSQDEGGAPQGFAVNVIVAPVEKKSVTDSIDLVGSLSPNEKVEITSEISGIVSKIHFDEGASVDEGEVLITLDDRKLAARLDEAQANFELAKTNVARNESLLKTNTISQQAYDQSVNDYEAALATLDLRRRELEDATIRAPFAGVLGFRRVSPGQFIQAGTVLTTLVNINPIKADFQVPERFIGELQRGQRIDIKVAAYPKRTFEGTVYFVSPEVDVSTRNVLVRANMDNEEHLLKPGMFGNLSLVLAVKEDALIIPESAVIVRADQTVVVVVGADNKAEFRPVKIGLRLESEVEVTEGLNAGEQVITEGHQKLGPGSAVNPLGPEAGESA